MNVHAVVISLCLGLSMAAHAASTEEADYYARMEAEAANIEALQKHQDKPVGRSAQERLNELRRVSPSAYFVYQSLMPQYKAEVRKALEAGKDVYEVRELIISRKL